MICNTFPLSASHCAVHAVPVRQESQLQISEIARGYTCIQRYYRCRWHNHHRERCIENHHNTSSNLRGEPLLGALRKFVNVQGLTWHCGEFIRSVTAVGTSKSNERANSNTIGEERRHFWYLKERFESQFISMALGNSNSWCGAMDEPLRLMVGNFGNFVSAAIAHSLAATRGNYSPNPTQSLILFSTVGSTCEIIYCYMPMHTLNFW